MKIKMERTADHGLKKRDPAENDAGPPGGLGFEGGGTNGCVLGVNRKGTPEERLLTGDGAIRTRHNGTVAKCVGLPGPASHPPPGGADKNLMGAAEVARYHKRFKLGKIAVRRRATGGRKIWGELWGKNDRGTQ